MKKYLLLLLLFGTVGAKCVLAQDSTWVKEYHAGEDVRLYHYDLIETLYILLEKYPVYYLKSTHPNLKINDLC